MSEAKTYRIETINDMLRVPADSRAALFRDLETALLFHEFVYAEETGSLPLVGGFLWADDGDHSVTMQDASGAEILKLEVTDATKDSHD